MAYIDGSITIKKIIDEKMQILRKQMKALRFRAEEIKKVLNNEKYLRGKMLKREVETWLKNVQDKAIEVQRIKPRVGYRNYFKNSFLSQVEKTSQEVAELIERGKFAEGLLNDVSPDREEAMVKASMLVGHSSNERNLGEIWECLMDKETIIIGVYGMMGIGKTYIMSHIHRLLKSSSGLYHVYWVTVSHESDILKLQDDIARVINVDLLAGEDESVRGAKLYKELKEKREFVLILDDVWQDFSFHDVGIPLKDNVGKVIVISRSLEVCQMMDCQQSIEVEPLSIEEAWKLFIKKLGHKPALAPEIEEIAKSVVEECAGIPIVIISTAISMRGVDDIHEWKNAPNELREHAKGINDMECDLFKLLKFSYDHLKDEKLQKCLLYCALFPQDDKIERNYLIMCWISEGLIDEMKTRQEEFDKGHAILRTLENACFLEHTTDYFGKICIKMHSVFRDMALDITRVNPHFMVKVGVQLMGFPNEKEWSENLERVSLMHNNIERQFSFISPKCPRLTTLMLQSNHDLREIPNSLFEYMPNLRVLDLSHLHAIKSLPHSISNLEKLRALLLCRCYNLRSVPSLEKLTELRELDLWCTSIEELPHGMEKLVNLKRLDLLHDTWNRVYMFQSGVLLELPHLQILRLLLFKITDYFHVEEISSLRQLEVLDVPFYNLHVFDSYVKTQHWKSLSRYSLQAVRVHYLVSEDEVRCREVHMRGYDLIRGEKDPLVLPTNIQELSITYCDDLTSLLDISSSLNNATELERCQILSCDRICCLWSWSIPSLEEESGMYTSTNNSLLQSLRTLVLHDLPKLSVIFNFKGVRFEGTPPKFGAFSNLKLFSVGNCKKLKYVFTRGLLQHHLQNVEVIHVYDCSRMENIIVAEQREDQEETVAAKEDINSIIYCPKLQNLELLNLPELKSICGGKIVCHSLQHIGIRRCPMLKRLPFSLDWYDDAQILLTLLHTLKNISGEQHWWDSLEWDDPKSKEVFEPLFLTKKMSSTTCFIRADEIWKPRTESKPYFQSKKVCCRELHTSNCNLIREGGFSLVLPTNIQELQITHCNHLTSLSDISSCLKNARKLERCWIEYCRGMKHLWSWSMPSQEESECSANTSLLLSLSTLRLSFLPKLIVLFNFKGVGVGGVPLKCRAFSNLNLLSIGRCPNLTYVFTSGLVQHHLQNLEVIHVYECSKMEDIFLAEDEEKVVGGTENNSTMECPKLRSLELDNLRKLKSIWKGTMVCSSLEQIEVRICPKLKRLPLPQTARLSQIFPNLKKISGEKGWWDSLQWDNPNIEPDFQARFNRTPRSTRYSRALELWRQDAECYTLHSDTN